MAVSPPRVPTIVPDYPTRPGAVTKQQTTKITKAPKKLEDHEENNT
jgi:hypothetical protein